MMLMMMLVIKMRMMRMLMMISQTPYNHLPQPQHTTDDGAGNSVSHFFIVLTNNNGCDDIYEDSFGTRGDPLLF